MIRLGEGEPSAQARLCLIQQPPEPHIQRNSSSPVSRHKRGCGIIKVVGGHFHPRVACDNGLQP